MNFKFYNKKNKKPKRVLILGSGGIVAKNLFNSLKKNKIKVQALGKKKINLKNESSVKLLSKKVLNGDVIILVAAEAPVKNIKMFINNLKICNNVCQALEQKKINHLIYISSDAVYADQKSKINEKSAVAPSSLHGSMHQIRESLLLEKFNKVLCILRPTLIFGFGDSHYGYGPNRFINLALKNKPISIFGNGEEQRDHIFIDDLTKIVIKCITMKGLGILNLASGKVFSFKHLATTIIDLINAKSEIIKIKRSGPMPHNGYRPFNISLIKSNFKDIKFTPIKIAIKKYLLDLKNYES